MTNPNFDRSRYDEMLSHGLTDGLGTTEKACIMACLNLACGGDLDDAAKSPCVLPAAAKFAVRLNDSAWSSEKARADGLYELGLALLGTDHLDQKIFALRLTQATIRDVVPVFMRRAGMDDEAKRCAAEGTRQAVRAGRDAARKKYYYAAAADDAATATATAAAYAAAAYAAAAYAAAATAADAALATAAAYRKKYGDETLTLSAKIATRILTEMKAEAETE